jgi:hypothetical protein
MKHPVLVALVVSNMFGAGFLAAQEVPVPGLAAGTIDGEAFEFALDCRGWSAQQQMVYAAGDDRRASDENGDGIGFVFNHFAPANATSAELRIDGRILGINAGFRPGPDAPQWEVSDTAASFSGPSVGTDSAQVEITVDCAPRSLVERGFTGSVTGEIDGVILDSPLFCGGWDGGEMIAARTEDGADPSVEISLQRANGSGTLVVEAAGETYEIVIAPIAGTEAIVTDDTVAFTADLRRAGENRRYAADLLFDCSAR